MYSACRQSCGRCEVEDEEGNKVFDRLNPNENGNTVHLGCSWLTRNKDKKEERISNYCFADDVCETASSVGDSCPVACGFSTGSNAKRPCPEKPEPVLPPVEAGSPPSPSGKGMSKGSGYSPSKGYPTTAQSASSPATSPSKGYPTATQSASSGKGMSKGTGTYAPASSGKGISKGKGTYAPASSGKGNSKGYTRGLRKMLRKTKFA